MGSMVIVIFQPFLGDFPELIKIFKDVGVQYILAESAIETLDIGILHGATGLNILNENVALSAPIHKDRTSEFRTVIYPNFHRNPVFPNSPFEHSDDPMTWEAEIRFDHQGLTVVIINDIENPESSFIEKGVVHEIHRPHLVNRQRHCQGLGFFTNKPFARLDAQVELQLLVDAIHTLVVPFEALDVAQIQVTQAKAPVAMVVRQPQQPVGHFGILSIELALVAVA